MANSYYTFTPRFVPFTRVRAEPVNSQFDALVAAFDLLPPNTGSLNLGISTLGVESGSGDTYIVTMPKTRIVNTDGDEVVFKATHQNTGAATLQVDAIPAVALRRYDGTALQSGDILVGSYYTARYSSTLGSFVIVSPALQTIPGALTYAAPSTTAKLTAAQGVLSTVLRSDAQIAIDQGIAPTWTSQHIFSDAVRIGASTSPINGALNPGVLNVGAASSGAITAYRYANYGHINLYRANGAEGAPTVVASANQIGAVRMAGYAGISPNTFYSAAEVQGIATQTWNGTTNGAKLRLQATATGAAVLSTVADFDPALIAFTATATTVSGTLAVAGAATLASLGVTAAATIGTTLSVADAATFTRVGTNASPTVELVSTSPVALFSCSTGATDEKNWQLFANAGQFVIRTLNDARNAGASGISLTRTATAVTALDLASQAITLTTSGSSNTGVTITGNGNIFTTPRAHLRLMATSTGPVILEFERQASPTGEKIWHLYQDSNSVTPSKLYLSCLSDARGVSSAAMVFTRTSTSIDSVELFTDAFFVSGISVTPASGTFTATATGMTTTITGTARYLKIGRMVVLYIPELSGTSNTTSLNITGLPSVIFPTRTQSMPVTVTRDNGTDSNSSFLSISAAGAISITRAGGLASVTTFTASGTKAIGECVVHYHLD